MAPTTRYQACLQRLRDSGQGHALTAIRSAGIRKNRMPLRGNQNRGTEKKPSKANQGQLEPGDGTTGGPHLVWDNVWMSQRTPPTVMILQMSRVFVEGCHNARILCFDLADRIESRGLLHGYSSTAIAGAIVHFAATSLGRENILNDKAAMGLVPSVREVPDAYNELWLQRYQFEAIVRRHGGRIARADFPMDKRGGIAYRIVEKSFDRHSGSSGIAQRRPRRAKVPKTRQSSRLRQEVTAEDPGEEDGDEMEDFEIEQAVDRTSSSLDKY